MRARDRISAAWLITLLVVVATGVVPESRSQAPSTGVCAKTWLGREAELEQYLKTARVERIEDIPLGVTKPRRAFLAPDGLIPSMAWKPLRPGIYDQHWESYRSEIAAYELDKILGLRMTPPAVERQVDGAGGAAVMWIGPVTMWRDLKREKRPAGNAWTFQIIRQRMFDDFIGNDDRNQGNLLIDGDGHLCLIDASRAFATNTNLPLKLEKIDAPLWGRIAALTEASLTTTLGEWLEPNQIRALLERRARMKQQIDKLVGAHGASKVFVAEGERK